MVMEMHINAYGNGVKIDTETETVMDEGDNAMAGKKKDRLSMWLGIAAGLVIAGIIFYIGLKLLIPIITPEPSEAYVVEDYTNKDFNDVMEELQKYGITAVDHERINSDKIKQDIIISQDVAVGNTLKPGSSIKFRISAGPELVQIPDISGQESRMGEQILRSLELIPEEMTEYSETVATGAVIRTEPAALEEVKPYSNVTIYVSLGPKLEMVKVPTLIGLTRAKAEKLILDSKLSIGQIIPSDEISDVALITKQYPLPGYEVEEGTAVEMNFTPIEEEPVTDPGTTEPEEEIAGEQEEETTPTESAKRTRLLPIDLDPSRSYGDEVMVFVETTPSDTNVSRIDFNESIPRTSFPFSVKITLADQGTTHVVVKLDGVLALEGDY